jgi:hypothetical protein
MRSSFICYTALVLHTDERPIVTDLLVASVPAAIGRFVEAGGKVIAGPFEIRIGLCAMIEHPWQNRLVILDSSKGSLRTDAEGNVIESVAPRWLDTRHRFTKDSRPKRENVREMIFPGLSQKAKE